MKYTLLVLWVEREQNKGNKWKMEKQKKKTKEGSGMKELNKKKEEYEERNTEY